MNDNLISKINKFESLPNQTVVEFNKIFSGNELSIGNLQDEVVIGEINGPVDVRVLTVGGKTILHEFRTGYSDPEPAAVEGRVISRDSSRNSVLEDFEMEMDPFAYMMLQFFRGSSTSYHQLITIAPKLKRSTKGIKNTLRSMEEAGIINIEHDASLHKMKITINEDYI